MIRAKMKCTNVNRSEFGEEVSLQAVYSSDKSDPNYSWSAATPSGSVKISISNPDALGKFQPGVSYMVDFTPA